MIGEGGEQVIGVPGADKVRGFTLVEMLVVLMTMGILLGLISVNIGPGDRDLLRLEAERLAQVLDLAADEARISGNSIAWTADMSGYRFWRLGASNEWAEIRDNDLLRPRKLSPGMVISDLRIDALRAQSARRIEFPPCAAMLAFTLDLPFVHEPYSVAASPSGDLGVSECTGKR